MKKKTDIVNGSERTRGVCCANGDLHNTASWVLAKDYAGVYVSYNAIAYRIPRRLGYRHLHSCIGLQCCVSCTKMRPKIVRPKKIIRGFVVRGAIPSHGVHPKFRVVGRVYVGSRVCMRAYVVRKSGYLC